MSDFATRLRVVLAEYRIQQKQVAETADMCRVQLSKITTGKVKDPKLSTLQSILKSIPSDIDIRWLLCGHEEQEGDADEPEI